VKKAVDKTPVPQRSVSELLRAALSRYHGIFTELAQSGRTGQRQLTPIQFSVLGAAASAKMVTQAFIRERAHVDRSTLSEMLIRLRRSGLVLEVEPPNGDKRIKLVRVTPEGLRRLAVARE
jgi:DNA-binding MarR family transcriptional regulator